MSKVVADVQKLYAKDKKATTIITTADCIPDTYDHTNTIVMPEMSQFCQLSGLPGIPYNKIIQYAGKPDSGKSTVGAEFIIAAQKAGIKVCVWDSEDKLDTHRLKSMGGVPGEIALAKTNEIRKGAELLRKYVTAIKNQDPEAKILLVWDSIGGSQSRSHAERELDSEKHGQPGQDAKENAEVMRMFVSLINKYPDSIAIYMANQTYAKIGFMQKGDAASGGAKVEYHSSFIVFLKRIKVLTKVVKGIKVKYGIITRATVTKPHLNQGKTSVHQMDFMVTADGFTTVEGEIDDGDEEE